MGGDATTGKGRWALAAARRRARRARLWARRARLDLRDRRAGDRDPLLPPRRLGLPANLPEVGEALADALLEHGRLGSDGTVLDIGCGPGRVAAPLTRRLGARSRYEGFDVMPRSVRWCERAITRRHPNFRFRLADIHNGQYNPGGTQTAADFSFPYADASFDAALASSVFTHMRPYESERYLSEAARVLRPGGRLLSTWFLITPAVAERIEAGSLRQPRVLGSAPLRLEHLLTDERGYAYRAQREDVPEFMVVVEEDLVGELHRRAGLRIVTTLHGSWSGVEGGVAPTGQDLVVAEPAA